MHCEALCQPPLVVLPAAVLERLPGPCAAAFAPRLQYSVVQRDKLYKSAEALEQFPYRLQRAAAFLRALAE
eukprot:10383795-Alexandrium_andersonii.AAC.1